MIGQTNKQRRIIPVAHIQREQDKPQACIDGSREWVTLVACICADGSVVPPSLIYKGSGGRVNANWATDADPTTQFYLSSSKKGWTNDSVGFDWLVQVFDPSTKKLKEDGSIRHRLLIVDGHSSHVNHKFLQQCDKLNIFVCVLPPHSTHRLQPLDVGLFSPLSTAYTTKQTEFTIGCENQIQMTKSTFFLIFQQAWKAAVTENNVRSAFQKSGIMPHNRAIVMDKVFTMPTKKTHDNPKG